MLLMIKEEEISSESGIRLNILGSCHDSWRILSAIAASDSPAGRPRHHRPGCDYEREGRNSLPRYGRLLVREKHSCRTGDLTARFRIIFMRIPA